MAEKTLTTKQQRAIAAMLSEKNNGEAAVAAGISERQLYRWLADPAFSSALRAAEGAAIEEASRRLVGLTGKALDQLEEVLDNSEAAPAVRVRAAQTILDDLMKLRELAVLESRISKLEALTDGKS